MYAAMLHHRATASADTSTLRTCISDGAAMPLEIMRGFKQTFRRTLLEAYGLSQTSPVASFNHTPTGYASPRCARSATDTALASLWRRHHTS